MKIGLFAPLANPIATPDYLRVLGPAQAAEHDRTEREPKTHRCEKPARPNLRERDRDPRPQPKEIHRA